MTNRNSTSNVPYNQPSMYGGNMGGMPGNYNQPNYGKNKSTKKYVIIGVIVALVVALVAVGILFFTSNSDSFFDSNSAEGQAGYKTREEIQAAVDQQVEEGMFNISISSIIEFENGTAPGKAYIENVPNNHYDMTVTITRDDTDEVIYQSKGLKPNSHIDEITLSQDLDEGTYPATATFTAHDTESHDEIGQAAAKVTLVVNG